MIVPFEARKKPCTPEELAKCPTIVPAGLMALAKVIWESAEASNAVMVPSLVRRKPCETPVTSMKFPVTIPAGFMAPAPVDVEPRGSNVVKVPLGHVGGAFP